MSWRINKRISARVLRHSSNRAVYLGAFGLLGVAIALIVVYPFINIFIKSLGLFGTTGSGGGINGFLKPFSVSGTWQAVINTFQVALGATLFALISGGFLAWLVTRTDFPCRRIVEKLTFLTFVIPPYILALAWLQFLGRNGYLHRILSFLCGLEDYRMPYYSLLAASIVLGIHIYPLVFMTLRNSLEKHSSIMEEAAILSGASPLKAALTISLPSILPSILSIGLLAFSRAMANFAIPALLALPVRKQVLTTRIYSSLSDLDIRSAATLSLLLVVLSASLFLFQGKILGKKSYEVEESHSAGRTRVRLRTAKVPIVVIVVLFLLATSILPSAVILISSFLKRWGLPLKAEFLTLGNYSELLFHNSKSIGAFWNSIRFGVTGASIACLLGGGVVLLSQGSKRRSARILEMMAGWPMAFPNIVLAVGAVLAWNKAPFRLYGTSWGIIITYIALFTPIVMKNVAGLVRGLSPAQVQMARLSGANGFQAFRDVTFRSVLPGLQSGWLLCFLIALREIPISLMLYSNGQETLGVLLFGMQSQAYGLEMTSALSVVIVLITLGINRVVVAGKGRGSGIPVSGGTSRGARTRRMKHRNIQVPDTRGESLGAGRARDRRSKTV